MVMKLHESPGALLHDQTLNHTLLKRHNSFNAWCSSAAFDVVNHAKYSFAKSFFFFFIIYFFEHSSKSSCIHSELFLHFYPKQNQTKNQQISKALMMILCFPSRTSGYGLMDPGSTTTPGAT